MSSSANDTNRFAVITGLPVYGQHANIQNVNVNDVITYKVKGRWIFSVVIGTTPTMIKVFDLFSENTLNGINLYINYKLNSTTKCLLKPTRKIFKIQNSKCILC
jgi:hypothetical protein